jgi:predicted secreted protein
VETAGAKEFRIKEGAIVKTIKMYGDDSLYRVQFYDKDGVMILNAGIKGKRVGCNSKSFELQDNERVLGMKSCLVEMGKSYEHLDTQFVIGKLD